MSARIWRGAAALLTVALLTGATMAPPPELLDAARRGDLAAVRALLRAGTDPNVAQGDGLTALHVAAQGGNLDIAKALIDAKANVEAKSRLGGYTPLHLAAQGGHVTVVRALLDGGAVAGSTTTTTGVTPLHLAAQALNGEAVIRLLVERGAPLEAKERQAEQTPLMFAAAAGRVGNVQELLRLRANPNAATEVVDVLARAAIDKAASEYLRNQMAEIRRNSAEGTDRPLTLAEQRQAVEAQRAYVTGEEVEKLLASFTPESLVEQEPLWDTPTGQKSEVLVPMRPQRATFVQKTGGMSPLLYAAREGHMEVARALLDGGADIDQRSAGDLTSPLLIAMINGWFDLGLELLGRGADPNLTSDAGTAPLFAVVNTQWGARPRHPQRMNHLNQKATYLETMKALLDKGADVNARLTKHIWYMAYTSGGGGYLGIDLWGATPFLRAAHGLDVEAMKLLVSYGADWNIPTKAPAPGGEEDDSPAGEAAEIGGPGVYPIHVVAGFGSYTASNYQRYVTDGWMPAVKYLVEELGADPNIRDYKGFNTSHYAAMRGNNELLVYVVEHGADPTVVGRGGQTASDLANGPGQGGVRFDDTIALLRTWGVEPTKPCPSCADLIIR